jgi:hypothetical protein
MPQSIGSIRSIISRGEEVILEVSATTATAICELAERASKRGEDRSFEYWFEEMALAGKTAQLRSWKYSDETRNSRDFNKAVADAHIKFVGGAPSSATDKVKYAEICLRYHMFDVTLEDVKSLRKEMSSELQAQLA